MNLFNNQEGQISCRMRKQLRFMLNIFSAWKEILELVRQEHNIKLFLFNMVLRHGIACSQTEIRLSLLFCPLVFL